MNQPDPAPIKLGTIAPFTAYWFFAAADVDEVNRELEASQHHWDEAYQEFYEKQPELTEIVRVIGADETPSGTHVWFLKQNGELLHRPAWTVREIPR